MLKYIARTRRIVREVRPLVYEVKLLVIALGLLIFLVSAILLWYRQKVLIDVEILSLGRFMLGIGLGVAVPAFAIGFLIRRVAIHHYIR